MRWGHRVGQRRSRPAAPAGRHGGAGGRGAARSSYGSNYSLAGGGTIYTPTGAWSSAGGSDYQYGSTRGAGDGCGGGYSRGSYDDGDEYGSHYGYGQSYGGKQGGCNPQDRGRRFLATNGGCVYIDLNHLELCLPEVLRAEDHVAAWHAMVRLAQDALRRANARMPEGKRIVAFANNSDGSGNSYGSHMNIMTTRKCWEDLFHRRLHHMLCLASHFVSSIVYTGSGKVGSENGRPWVDYQIAQRADFFEALTGMQTTYHRPIVNSRDEALCGPSSMWRREAGMDEKLARLHVIFYDSTLCHVASFLKIWSRAGPSRA